MTGGASVELELASGGQQLILSSFRQLIIAIFSAGN
jgi:hypothetical protein